MGNSTYYWSGNNLKHGSQGYEVEQLQTFLKNQGYYTGSIDGDFGDVTDGALRAYQRANGIGDDGIFGPTTAAKAGFKNYNTPVGAANYTPLKTDPYTGTVIGKDANGNDITDIQAKYDASNAITGYKDPEWGRQDEHKTKVDEYLGRDPFSYDFNADALYQQYKDMYMQQGKVAMQDAMGQAAAMTGGYGNSYAATVGNQAYQEHLGKLNEVIPELYQLALNKHNQEGQDMLDAIGMLESDRAAYLADWQRGYDRLMDNYTLADDMYKDNESKHYTDLGLENDAIVEENTNAWKTAEWDETQRRYELERAEASKAAVKDTVKDDVKDDDEDPDDEKALYADWDAGDWSTYFSQIRHKEGAAAAEKELNYFISQGLIPQKMLAVAAMGARGSLGH